MNSDASDLLSIIALILFLGTIYVLAMLPSI